MPVPAQTLDSVPMFRRLAADDRERLAAASEVRTFHRGEAVFHEGQPAAWLLVVLAGRIKIYRVTPAGGEVIVNVFGPGDLLGAVALYEGRPFPANAAALEDSAVLATPAEVFFRLLESHPSLVRGLLSGLTQRLLDLTNRLTELSGGRVEARFARLFLKLAQEHGRNGPEGIDIPFPLSRQELADLCGTTIETTIRVLSRWGKENLVLTEKHRFVVVDRVRLDELAQR